MVILNWEKRPALGPVTQDRYHLKLFVALIAFSVEYWLAVAAKALIS